ncbi:MAG: hypothetical protein QME48_06060 [bacterium]|nr:hypothetical protein [bacterium]
MFLIFSISLTLLAIFILWRRVSKRKFYLSTLILLISFLIFSLSSYLPNRQSFVVIDDEEENLLTINEQKKYDTIKKFFGSSHPFYISDKHYKNDIFISSKTKTFNLRGKVDFGIDSVVQTDSLKILILKNYTGYDTLCSLKIYIQDRIYDIGFKKDTSISFKEKEYIDSVKILTFDQNNFNNTYIYKKYLNVLLVDDNYSKNLQNISNKISSLYDSVKFNTGILKEGKIVSMKKNYDGIVYIGKGEHFRLGGFYRLKYDGVNINFFKNVEEILEKIKGKNITVKNPFNKKNSYKNNIFAKFLFFFKGYSILIILFVILFSFLAFLF